MLKWIIRRRLAGVERAYDYNMSCARDILDASLTAFRRFAGIIGGESIVPAHAELARA
jgi:hypothetical protein